jgi:2-octaprenyl-6-methoxyphenol hydroxylase
VWSEKSELAPQYMAMNDTDFVAAATERFTDYLGALKLASPRWQYPLSLSFATQLYGERVALVGDSAHFIHPIAGQGFNQSMKDIAALAALISARHELGLDIGTEEVLATYHQERKLDNYQMIAATDGLNRLFSNNLKTARIARRIGLGLVQKLPSLKKTFMRHAMAVKKSA